MHDDESIAVLGLGAMGSRMAARLIEAGYPVTVYNRSDGRASELVAKGAAAGSTPREAARGASVVISCVRDDEAARAVWLDADRGALAAMEPGSLMVESSTLTPDCVRELSRAAATRGVGFVDAPVVGSRPQAEAGQLIYLVGGDSGPLARARPILERLGGAIHHVGPAGTGAAMKLAVNALFAIQIAALGELFAIVDRAGVEPAAALEILSALPVTSPAVKGAGGLIVTDNHAPMFPIELVEKDLGFVEELADRTGASAPTTAAAREVYARALAAGSGGLNITGVAKLFA